MTIKVFEKKKLYLFNSFTICTNRFIIQYYNVQCYNVTEPFTLTTGCGGVFTTPSGSIHSPNYPQNYDRNTDCIWTITVDPLHIVDFTFIEFDMGSQVNCSYSSLSVSNILLRCIKNYVNESYVNNKKI